MKVIKTALGNQVEMSRSEWEKIGKTAGWYEEDVEEKSEGPEEAEWVSYSYGMTPPEVIKERTMAQTPDGYPMHIKSQDEWTAIAEAVNQGIDSHLEGFTRSTFQPDGICSIHPEEMTILLRRLSESENEEAQQLRTDILYTLNIEEI